MKNSFQLSDIDKSHFHIIVVFAMTIITMKIAMLILDGLQISLAWVQSNIILEFMVVLLSFFILFLIYDVLLSSTGVENGLLLTFIMSMREDFDVDEYIKDDYYSAIDKSYIVDDKFVKEFDSNTFGNSGRPLEGVEINKNTDVNWTQIDKVTEEFVSIPEEEFISIAEEDDPEKARIENGVRKAMLKLMEEKIEKNNEIGVRKAVLKLMEEKVEKDDEDIEYMNFNCNF